MPSTNKAPLCMTEDCRAARPWVWEAVAAETEAGAVLFMDKGALNRSKKEALRRDGSWIPWLFCTNRAESAYSPGRAETRAFPVRGRWWGESARLLSAENAQKAARTAARNRS